MEALRPQDPSRVAGYRLLGLLGEGGMGVVYLARSPDGTLAALKVVREEYVHDPGFRARFAREVAAARRVSSPYAVPVVADGDEDGTPWLASPYVPGPALSEAVVRHGPLPPRSVRALGSMLAEALGAVHAAGLVHRDVKPGNVLLALDGPRLIDFGIARAAEGTALTGTGTVVGSPGYLSPEQAAGRDVGPPSDVFSLGCVLAYAAGGRPPFGTGAAEALLYRTVHDRADLDAVPGELRGTIAGCLAKNEAERPALAALRAELAEDASAGWLPQPLVRLVGERTAAQADLRDIVPTEPVPAAPAGPAAASDAPGPHGPARPSRRGLLALLGSGAVVAGGGLAVWLWPSGGGGEARAGDSGPRHVIGLHADLGGRSAAWGRAQERGALLALDEVMNAEDAPPFALELRVVDDGGDPGRAAEVADELAADSSVLAVVGPTDAAVAASAGAVYEAAGMPLLSLSVGSFPPTPEVPAPTTLLHARPTNAWQGLALRLHLANGLGAGRVALVDDRAAELYSWEITRPLTNVAEGVPGFDLVPYVLPKLTAPFDTVVSDLLTRDVDALVFGGHHERAAALAGALRGAGFDRPCFASEAVLRPEFVELAGEAAEGWRIIATCADPAAGRGGSGFVDAHRRRFDGEAPEPFAAEAYDAVRLLAWALREASAGGAPDRAGVLARAREADHRGVGKHLAFDEDGRYSVADDGLYLYEVRDGAFRFAERAPSLGG